MINVVGNPRSESPVKGTTLQIDKVKQKLWKLYLSNTLKPAHIFISYTENFLHKNYINCLS